MDENADRVREIKRASSARHPETYRRWVNENPEKVAARQRRYRERHPEKVREASRLYSINNTEKIAARRQRYATENAEKLRAATREWGRNNRSKLRERLRERYREDPAYWRALAAKRRAAKRAATPADSDQNVIRGLYKLAQAMTVKFGVSYHVDHVVPLAKGGLHHQDNLVIMRSDLNIRKRDLILPALIQFFTPYDPKDFDQ